MAKIIVSVEGLTYNYPKTKTPALINVNMDVSEGEFVVIAGPSGGGKSTLCRVLTGLIPHSYGGELRGSVYINGINVAEKGPRSIVGLVGTVFQVPENQIVNLIVEEELAFTLENLNIDPSIIRDRIDQVMKELGIEHLRKRNTLELSGGEAQKVLIASVLALKPKILLLDEPLAHLDPYSAANLINLLNELNKKDNITIIVFEHRLSDIVKYADKLIVLNKTVIMSGQPRDIVRELIIKGDQSIEIPVTAELSHKIGLSKIVLDIDEFINETNLMRIPHSYDCHNYTSFDEDTSNEDGDKVIVIRDLWYEYPNNKVALRNINLEVNRGEVIALIGANGAGKTTLLKHLNGLLKPTRGIVTVYGHDTRGKSVTELSNYVGIVFQTPLHQFFEETVIDEVLVAAKIRNIPNAYEKALNLLKFLGIDHLAEKSPFELSVGEQRRLAIASILIYDPPILVLDEPTAGLDKGWKSEIAELLNQLLKNGKTIIIATHDIEFLTSLYVSRVIVMNKGEIITSGSPRRVLYQYEKLVSSHVIPPQIIQITRKLALDNVFKPLRTSEFLELVRTARCKSV